MDKFDLVVIGSGPAGEKGAARAAQFGKRVALIERSKHLGGAGINTGTVPSKTLRETALYFSGLEQRGLYGIDYSLREGLSVREFMHREHIVVDNERRMVSEHVQEHGIERMQGTASLKDAHTVQITTGKGTREIGTDFILIATGSSPFHPSGIPFDHKYIFDSDTILGMDRIPKSMVVVGGGVIGMEYASIFTALGVDVTLVESHDRVLHFVDSEIVDRLRYQLELLGLKFVLNGHMNEIEVQDERVRLTLENDGVREFDIALMATGRRSNVEELELEQVGVQMGERGLILVNDDYQTSVPNIYAAGDVIGFPALAATSMEQARVAVTHVFGQGYEQRISPILPFAVYAIPELSMVGMTEDQCKEKSVPHVVGRGFYQDSARGQIIGDMSGMVKLIFSPADRKLLGAHIIGEQASELIHVASHVLHTDGTIDAFIQVVYNYPTLSDLYKTAAYDALAKFEE